MSSNYAVELVDLGRFEETRSLLRKTTPVALRVHGGGHEDTLRMRWAYAKSLFKDPAATLDDLREVVTTLEDTSRIARRVLGSAHPFTKSIETALQDARAELRACETPSI